MMPAPLKRHIVRAILFAMAATPVVAHGDRTPREVSTKLATAWSRVLSAQAELESAVAQSPDDIKAASRRLERAQLSFGRALSPADWLTLPSTDPPEMLVTGLHLLGMRGLDDDPAMAVAAFERLLVMPEARELESGLRAQLLPEAHLLARAPTEARESLGALRDGAPPSDAALITIFMADAAALAGDVDTALARADEARTMARALPPTDPQADFILTEASGRLSLLGKRVPEWTPLAELGRRGRVGDDAPLMLVTHVESWCPLCINDLPPVARLARQHANVHVVGVTTGGRAALPADLGSTPEAEALAGARALVRQHRPAFPFVVLETTFPILQGVDSLPVHLLLDHERRVVFAVLASSRMRLLRRAVELLGEPGHCRGLGR